MTISNVSETMLKDLIDELKARRIDQIDIQNRLKLENRFVISNALRGNNQKRLNDLYYSIQKEFAIELQADAVVKHKPITMESLNEKLDRILALLEGNNS